MGWVSSVYGRFQLQAAFLIDMATFCTVLQSAKFRRQNYLFHHYLYLPLQVHILRQTSENMQDFIGELVASWSTNLTLIALAAARESARIWDRWCIDTDMLMVPSIAPACILSLFDYPNEKLFQIYSLTRGKGLASRRSLFNDKPCSLYSRPPLKL